MKTNWNLELFYKNGADPRIEKDMQGFEKLCTSFEKKYKKYSGFLKKEKELLKALEDYEKIIGYSGASKAIEYFYYRQCLNVEDKEAESKLNQLSERATKASNKIIFFELAIGNISKQDQKKLLKLKTLSHFKYFLEKIFTTAEYNLSEPEEKILNLKSLPSHSMWVQGQQKLLNIQVVQHKGKNIPLSEAYNLFSDLPTQERRTLSDNCNEVLKSISYFAESEINAVYTDKKINDELRGLKNPYSATILGYLNTEKSIENLVKTVTEHFPISHAFYALKAKMLKLPYFEYADRAARIGKISREFSFESCVEIVRKSFRAVNPKYETIFNSYLEQGQIDVFPKKGKRGGAFCSGSIGLPTFVFLNHVRNLNSLGTIAHEMGHAIHTELSKSQTPIYQHYPISIAEVASTLFENFITEEVFSKLSDSEKIIVLHDRINDAIATVFRQIACFNFEKESHEIIRSKGALSKEEIAALHNKHMQAYLGPKFKMKENDGYMFVAWPHIRNFFYVYSYAYGDLISKALYANYKKDPRYLQKIEEFLSAGSSQSPENIFKSIGIDTTKPDFFVAGLKQIEEDIKNLESLID